MSKNVPESQIIKWFKVCLVVSLILWVAIVASCYPKQQPCQCQCEKPYEKPYISTTSLQVTYDK